MRLARLPRLYRLLKLLRLTKMGSAIRTNLIINNILFKIRLSIATAKMLNILIMVLYINHVGCCFWYFTSKISDNDPDTWVVKNELLDQDYYTKYITSYYWGFQTFTTIGLINLTKLK